ncbi:transcriptional regulator, IclR family [Streptoalloteichus tenebrarius]|uniref:Transcriptional regulator, IclR family n=1 Tax=Streptoalloteichus tenebrarius (strain ATCC 17920 / DSM 40477 / JCM 4838 / CBS 697.72 / NBRC 16177 / NCIMB 11028 / NRRL B-12390 / A12253. 1 / ISP 5477) TaxID=1933 RepID=A0ABT1HLX3_STRSD|nr:IclR family transcriptional regulator C-terminal domain-containing protein [Streptoalloteichus tenebrarius]MCP2256495.1 transcriptional regulator, IclR family [Streptoalloteichus tenebrarius]BFF04847.1 IclR family transcriptional regulator C-terminal domain-containing protein [Streptoalloteichus tenebrarius]
MPRPATAAPVPDTPSGDELVGPLDRGLTVLRTLATSQEPRLRPGDLARATGLARATVDRIVSTLARLGHVRVEGREVLLAPRLLEIGNAYLAASGIPSALGPHLARLAEDLDESVSVAVPDHEVVRLLTQRTRPRAVRLSFRIGLPLPADRCSPGPLFATSWDEEDWRRWDESARLRELPADRVADFRRRVAEAGETGFAVDDQYLEPGLIAVSVPVPGADGTTACTVNVVSDTSRHTARGLVEHALPRLRASVPAMAADLARPAAEKPAGRPVAGGLRAHKDELGPEFLQSLARGLAVLTALRAPGGRTLSEVADATGLPRATARRALLSLQQRGYVAPARDQRRFALQPRVLELGYAKLSRLTFEEIVQPHLADLVEQVHDSASVAVLDGEDIRYVARVATVRIMSVDIRVGTRFPAYATAMGRVLLAGLPDEELAERLSRHEPRPFTPHTRTTREALAVAVDNARRDGFALVEQELDEGLRSIAVPLRDRAGRVVAAVNVATPVSRRTSADLRERVLPALRATADRIAVDLAEVGERGFLPLP